MKIKENDTSPLQTGRDVIIVTPTYAWRIPKIVSEWIDKTESVLFPYIEVSFVLKAPDCILLHFLSHCHNS